MNIYPFSNAADNTICLAKNPNNGGIPAKENKVIARHSDNIAFLKKKPVS